MRTSLVVLETALAFVLVQTMSASAAEPLMVTVRIYDYVGLSRSAFATARSTAGVILKQAGIDVAWRECAHACIEPIRAGELMVRIVRAPASVAPAVLGYSVVDVRRGAGALATVFNDRIQASATRVRVAAAPLLGRAIAHEIGHLLLGTSAHSREGLMRALWSDHELERAVPGDWELSKDDAAHLADQHANPREPAGTSN